jgi:hypothetical protein
MVGDKRTSVVALECQSVGDSSAMDCYMLQYNAPLRSRYNVLEREGRVWPLKDQQINRANSTRLDLTDLNGSS